MFRLFGAFLSSINSLSIFSTSVFKRASGILTGTTLDLLGPLTTAVGTRQTIPGLVPQSVHESLLQESPRRVSSFKLSPPPRLVFPQMVPHSIHYEPTSGRRRQQRFFSDFVILRRMDFLVYHFRSSSSHRTPRLAATL